MNGPCDFLPVFLTLGSVLPQGHCSPIPHPLPMLIKLSLKISVYCPSLTHNHKYRQTVCERQRWASAESDWTLEELNCRALRLLTVSPYWPFCLYGWRQPRGDGSWSSVMANSNKEYLVWGVNIGCLKKTTTIMCKPQYIILSEHHICVVDILLRLNVF